MSRIKTVIRQLKFRLKHDFFSIENIVLLASILLCLVWTYKSIESMSKNWELSERLNSERKSLELLQVEVELSELENEYYKTEEYQEIAARKYADKKKPGESMVILPENSEEAKNKHKKVDEVEEKKEYTNIEKWWMFLFPKSQTSK